MSKPTALERAREHLQGLIGDTLGMKNPELMIRDLVEGVYGDSHRIMEFVASGDYVTPVDPDTKRPTWSGTGQRSLKTYMYGVWIGYATIEHFDLQNCNHKTVDPDLIMRVLAFARAELGQQCCAAAVKVISNQGYFSYTHCAHLPAFQKFAHDMRDVLRRAI